MLTPRYHWLFDVSAIRQDITEPETLGQLLRDLAQSVEMQVLAGPLLAEGHPDNPGITGIVVVDYSHISIHTFTRNQEALIDIFSCKPYDRLAVKDLLISRCCTDSSVIREQNVHWGE